jgi:hypothetical protein
MDRYEVYGAYMEYPLRGSVIDITGTCTQVVCIDCHAGYMWGVYEPEPPGVDTMRLAGCYRCGSGPLSVHEQVIEFSLGQVLRCGKCRQLNGQRQFDHYQYYVGIYCDSCFDLPKFNSYRTYIPQEALEEDV